METILTSIKKLLGIQESFKNFDDELVMNINTVFMDLRLLGIGPSSGFVITDGSEVWTDFLDDATDIEGVKTYIYLKVRLVFDPPQSSAVIAEYNKRISELEWKLNVSIDPKPTT